MGGKQSDTMTTKSEPWGPMQGYLTGAASWANDLSRNMDFTADQYPGQRVQGFGGASQAAQQMVVDRAGQGAPLVGQAAGTLSGMMSGDHRSQQLEAVKQNALGGAIPSAVAQFSGSGMANSSLAMDTVGRAAMDAVAPYEYGAFENAQGRALSAAGMAPTMDAAGYLPAQMVAGVGSAQDAMGQAYIDAEMGKHYEGENRSAQNFQGYLNAIMGLGGMGQAGQSTGPAQGPSTGQRIGGGILGGLGTYGTLMSNPITAPFGVIGGLGAGLAGLL